MTRSNTTPQRLGAEPVAIVGMAILLPGAPDLESYWNNLVNGVDSITEVPAGRWDGSYYRADAAQGPARADEVYCRRGGFVDELAGVEVTRFGITPSSVPGTEPDQLIALQVAASAIADAGGADRLPSRNRVGVVLGRGGYLTPGLARLDQRVRTARQLVRTLSDLVPDLGPERLERVRSAFTDQLGPNQPADAIGLVPNLAASRIANRLDLRGPAYTVDAACASSLIAVDHAVGELSSGRCDVVLAGGVHHCHDITLWSVFSQLRALSAREQIRPFDRAADGVLIGEGTGVVALKRLSDAERDGDRIYAVIRGTGVASDGRGGSLFHPDSGGQVLALERAWHAAGLDPAEPGSLGLLEAHGTATPAGDLAELTTLRRVFGGPRPRSDRAVIGSVKSMIGHAMPAAGVAGLVKAALAVHRGVLLPTLHCDDPHPALADTRFRPLTTAQPWEHSERRAAVNAFGFGGINAHVVLEQHPSTKDAHRGAVVRRSDGSNGTPVAVTEPEPVLRLSAGGPGEMAELLSASDSEVLALGLAGGSGASGGCRLGIVDPSAKRLALARKVASRGTAWRGRNDVWFSPTPLLTERRGRVAFVFPGLEADFEPRVEDVANRFGLPCPELSASTVARHGASVMGVGRLLDTALKRLNVVPDAVAGHSVGEWTAMIAGGIHSASEVDRLLEHQDLDSLRVPGVEFAVLGCGIEHVAEAIADNPDIVVSHENSTHQTIVCGKAEAVDAIVRDFRAHNVLCQVLPFRSGFHTPMLEPYLAPLRSAVGTLGVHRPTVPVWSATTASIYPYDEAEVRALYIRHLLEPVRFRSLIQSMYATGFRVFVQVGPGQLGSLIDDTLNDAEHLTVAANSAHREGLAQLRRVSTAFWVEGGEPMLEALAPVSGMAGDPVGRPAVKLDLSAPLISVDSVEDGVLPRTTAACTPASDSPLAASFDELGELGDIFPEAAELSALLRETADTAKAVIRTARGAPVATMSAGGVTASGPTSTAAPREVPPTAVPQEVLRVSTEAMPYVLDHCFAPQREDWPNEADRRPVVPATTVVKHMMDAAELAEPGLLAVGVQDVRLNRWLVAAPPVDVPVTVSREGAQGVRVEMGEYAQATVVLAKDYPRDVPPAWSETSGKAEGERLPTLTAQQFYAERWMFHGPRFQGITELTAFGDRHVRAVITVPPAPGSLLDNVGQLFGHWIVETQTAGRVVFPVAIRSIRFFGPEPEAGTHVECGLRITSISATRFAFDAQVIRQGEVWAEITGWQDHRFDSHPDTEPAYRVPEINTLSTRQPGDWVLLPDRWASVASRDLYLHKYLNAPEREEHHECSPRAQRHWALGRMAVKDAVRGMLWDRGWGPVFPAEILVTDDAAGRPTVTGRYGLRLPRIEVSLAHCGELGVAIARGAEGGTGSDLGVGIDVEEIKERPQSTVDFALLPSESTLLSKLPVVSGEPEALWFTRFWCAKEAVSKAVGTGLRGQPKRFVVLGASPSHLLVKTHPENGRSRVYDVWCDVVSNPEDLPSRKYVVAWTTGQAEQQEENQ
jgi:acyl transferase domain-containing protein/phosphopantetheinyl transferase